MTASVHALAKALLLNLLPSPTAARTTSTTGAAINLLDYEGTGAMILDSAAATAGTTPTLDVTLEESDDGSTNWTAVPPAAYAEAVEFAQVTTTASQQVRHFNVSDRKQFVREKHVIGGSASPSFVHSLNLLAKKKYS